MNLVDSFVGAIEDPSYKRVFFEVCKPWPSAYSEYMQALKGKTALLQEIDSNLTKIVSADQLYWLGLVRFCIGQRLDDQKILESDSHYIEHLRAAIGADNFANMKILADYRIGIEISKARLAEDIAQSREKKFENGVISGVFGFGAAPSRPSRLAFTASLFEEVQERLIARMEGSGISQSDLKDCVLFVQQYLMEGLGFKESPSGIISARELQAKTEWIWERN